MGAMVYFHGGREKTREYDDPILSKRGTWELMIRKTGEVSMWANGRHLNFGNT